MSRLRAPNVDALVKTSAGQELAVETDPDHLAVRLRGAEIYLHLLQWLGFEHQLGLGLGALVPRRPGRHPVRSPVDWAGAGAAADWPLSATNNMSLLWPRIIV